MLQKPPWMQPPPQTKPCFRGKNPKNTDLACELAVGVFSETQDYTGRTTRASILFLMSAVKSGLNMEVCENCGYFLSDKSAAQLPVRFWGGADAEK